MDTFIILITIIVLMYFLFKWLTSDMDYFDRNSIKHLKRTSILGNTLGLLSGYYSVTDYLSQLHNSFPSEKIIGVFDGFKPMLLIRDPNLLKQLTIKEFDHFLDHLSFLGKINDEIFGNGLLMMTGEKWRDMRSTISPAFTGSKMRQMFQLITECSDQMNNYFVLKVKENEKLNIDVKEIFSRFTNDVIATCAFGLKTDSFTFQNNEFYTTGKRFMNFNNPLVILKFILLKFIPTIMYYLDIGIIARDIKDYFSSIILDAMNVRKQQGIFRPDLINLLMQIRDSGTIQESEGHPDGKSNADGFATAHEFGGGKSTAVKRQWTDIEIVAQCFVFFAAGFETTATTLSFAAYELAINPELQQKLYEEIYETHAKLSGKNITYDGIQDMTYLDMVICEVLRKWPPIPVTDRLCIKDYQYVDDGENHNFLIKRGMSFWIPIYALHHDAKYFPKPEIFDPERFSEENKHKINMNAYIPFGSGPRNCIGSRFALLEVKIILYKLLLNFEFIPNDQTQIPLKIGKSAIGLVTTQGIHLEMKSRNKNM